MDTIELLLHPVRLRIVHALSGERTLTTAHLHARMPDVSKATMYRQVSLLFEGGILEVDHDEPVGGTVERWYRLRRSSAVITSDAVAAASLDDYRRVFAVAMAALLGEFNAYLDRGGADPSADAVGFRQHGLWLSPQERDELIGGLRKAIVPWLNNEPAPGRRQYLLSPILFPIEDEPSKTPSE
ncbi:ArsR family transcriptional regulator [Ktedonosporobacter rubrisoli]|uniref:ArsR family transcriptional regulator n=1 Tax=Ktedonosporobacter rubrisoli TaxID=2509675 RepID=A0A4P6JVW0_KTERU|nr:helix-turn-helix domain-containing protein [Ktedonosporobacter rubrisoli]QBD79523.1 ArsR family transcriptional regulator [Ktedonosporobacter rubrisoli]